MNVLLAEAMSLDEVFNSMTSIGSRPPMSPLIGANDVTNPVLQDDPKSPISASVLDVEKANTGCSSIAEWLGLGRLENAFFFRTTRCCCSPTPR